MAKPLIIKNLNKNSKMTFKDYLIKILWYNPITSRFRKFDRFLKRLPSFIRLCWDDETWDFEGLYNYIEYFLKSRRKALEKDKWHTEECVNKAIKEIDDTFYHLDHYRNWPSYYEWPDPVPKQLSNGNWILEYKEEDKPKCDLVYKMEHEHYETFWKLLKENHRNWWT